MNNRVSLKKEFYEVIKSPEIPPLKFIRQSIIDEESLVEKEDYFFVGDDIYIYLKTALYIIARFQITDINIGLLDIMRKLSVPVKVRFYGYSDPSLPAFDSIQQEWNDKMRIIVTDDASYLGIEFTDLLKIVYRDMGIDFPCYKKNFLKMCNMSETTKVANFHLITCDKNLRIKFENSLAKVMKKIAIGALDITRERERLKDKVS